jgi:hypothetical protein
MKEADISPSTLDVNPEIVATILLFRDEAVLQ